MKILETERTILREIVEADAEFILDLLNQPSFIKYIGDRNVRTLTDAREFIENRFRQSYRENGFGLYTVELKETNAPIGICGFVKRDSLPFADIGFAFLPQFENKGYAFESAKSVLDYGRSVLGLKKILAIVSPGNVASEKLLEKINFEFEQMIEIPEGVKLQLFALKEQQT